MKCDLPKNIYIDNRTGDLAMKSKMTKHTTKSSVLRFYEKLFFNTILAVMKTEHSIGTFSSEKPDSVFGIGKNQLKKLLYGSIVNGIREPNYYSFAAHDSPDLQKISET